MLNAKHCDKFVTSSLLILPAHTESAVGAQLIFERPFYFNLYIKVIHMSLDNNMTLAKILNKKYLTYLGTAPTY